MLETLNHRPEGSFAIPGGIGAGTVPGIQPTIIINADDWGRDRVTTDRSLDCLLRGAVSSVSAMVFMQDSQRASELACQHGVDAGLHLNLTTPFSSPQCPPRLAEHQGRLARFLTSNRLAQVVYHPGLAGSFEYVVKAQLEEFGRLYGPAARVDGHHHMHLCANVLFQKLLPEGTIVRRNFSFAPGEKSAINRFYRNWQDRSLARRHSIADFFFSLPPLEPRSRLQHFFDLANRFFYVELETHPAIPEEYDFLRGREFPICAGKVRVARGYRLRSNGQSAQRGIEQ